MSDYIKREDAIKAIEKLTWYHFNEVLGKMIEGANTNVNQPYYKSDDIFKAIDEIPTADVVENVRLSPITTATENKPVEYVKVVRCKECKYWNKDTERNDGYGYCSYWQRFIAQAANEDIQTYKDVFCCYGERKDDE